MFKDSVAKRFYVLRHLIQTRFGTTGFILVLKFMVSDVALDRKAFLENFKTLFKVKPSNVTVIIHNTYWYNML